MIQSQPCAAEFISCTEPIETKLLYPIKCTTKSFYPIKKYKRNGEVNYFRHNRIRKHRSY